MYHYIYKTTNLVNGKIYVGKRSSHVVPEKDNNYWGSGKIFKRALKKYKRKNHRKDIIEEVSIENIKEKEIYWIKYFNAINPLVGYNIDVGGGGGDIVGKLPNKLAIYKKLADAKRGKKQPAISAAKKGIALSEAHKKSLSKPRPLQSKVMSGRKFTNKHKQSMSDAQKLIPFVICPHCGKEGKKNAMSARHFNNCINVNPDNKKLWEQSDISKQKIRDKSLKRTKSLCIYCLKEFAAAPMAKYHGEKCKNRNNKINNCAANVPQNTLP